MHVRLNHPEPIELAVQGRRYRIRKNREPQYRRWQIIAEILLPDGRIGGFHVLADTARSDAELDQQWTQGWEIDRSKSAWPIACALMAMPPP